MNGRADHWGINTFNWRYCRSLPQTGPGMLIASMKILWEPSAAEGPQYMALELRWG